MNKLISLTLLSALALVSCKKEVETEKAVQGSEIITEQKQVNPAVVDPNGKFAQMQFSSLEHDFGTINQEKSVETIFTFANTGEADLLISNAVGSCGCTVPEYPRKPIAPGEKADIKVSFSPKGKTGMQSKTVTLTTNTLAGTEQLTIKANIVQ